MLNLTPGDLVTFPLRGASYGVALVVHVDDLALNDLYHFAICDAVVDESDGGEDQYGSPLPRVHDTDEVSTAPVLIEHIALTRHGLEASDLVVVTDREVTEDDLEGYRAWLHLRYQDAVRRGVMRERIDDNPDDEEFEEELEEASGEELDEVSGEELAEEREGESTDAAEEEPKRDEEIATDAEPPIASTTLGVHDVALGVALIRQRAIFERPIFSGSSLGRYIMQLGDDGGAIEEIIARLLDGDFGAGDELMDYGEAGMRMLGSHLGAGVAPELADDILQVLVNSGETVAYERVGSFMETHGTDRDDPLYASAVRAYCYAVMLTAGEPEALKTRLGLLESVKDAELLDDVRSAREALADEA
ncbi:MAG TPA: hypothetical protein VNA88_18460 [Candidatus Kapabacteria bacterium]|nr:hypothetical protein [Candidatus Kapabacteria bacterium]